MEKVIERPGVVVICPKTTPNKDRRHRGEIPGWAESQFFVLMAPICNKRGWSIQYEPKTFTIACDNGIGKISTAPDFCITRPGKKDLYIELERAYYDSEDKYSRDPKIRQKRIMSYFPEVDYIVLYRQDMDRIEKKHPNISFKPLRNGDNRG